MLTLGESLKLAVALKRTVLPPMSVLPAFRAPEPEMMIEDHAHAASSAQLLPSALDATHLAMSLPVRGPISSRFGPRGSRLHRGIDIAGVLGSAIHATGPGTVIYAAARGTYGLLVIVDHGGGVQTRYAHMSSLNVSIGEVVETGAVLGQMGATGRARGVHVHYEVRREGKPVDPLG